MIWSVHDWKVDRAVATREEVTDGVITAHDAGNHNQYKYTFTVEGKSYDGWQSPREDELHIGKQVRVYYDPKDPSTSALTEFSELAISALGPIPLLTAGICAFVVFIIYWRRANPEESQRPPSAS
jgi:hypothetical protein